MSDKNNSFPFWFASPFSGDVSQAINPLTFLASMTGNQYGLINVQGKSTDPDMEKEILSEVGSYGRQLGILSRALYVWAKHVNVNDLESDEERLAVLSFRKQIDEIDNVKKKRKLASAS